MQLGARGAQRDRQATKKLMGYSKQWSPGDTMRVFLPLVWLEDGQPDIMVGQVWGHQVNDVKGLGLKTTFIPSLTEFTYDGKPVGTPDITYQFSRIAPIFVNGQKEKEMKEQAAKPWPTSSQREQALSDVKNKFDSKNNRQAVKPIIGKARYIILCEPISCKYNEVTGIVRDSIALSTWALSDEMLTKIESLLLNTKFKPKSGDKFFEFEITYPTDTDKGKSGSAAVPAGLTEEYKLANKFPDDFQLLSGYFSQWSADATIIKTRATTQLSEEVIHEAIRGYCMMNSNFLDSIEDDNDIKVLTNNIGIVSSTINTRFLSNEQLKTTLTEAIAQFETAKSVSTSMAAPEPEVPDTAAQEATTAVAEEVAGMAADVPNLEIPNVTGAPTVADLIGSDLNIGSDANAADILGDVDFSNLG